MQSDIENNTFPDSSEVIDYEKEVGPFRNKDGKTSERYTKGLRSTRPDGTQVYGYHKTCPNINANDIETRININGNEFILLNPTIEDYSYLRVSNNKRAEFLGQFAIENDSRTKLIYNNNREPNVSLRAHLLNNDTNYIIMNASFNYTTLDPRRTFQDNPTVPWGGGNNKNGARKTVKNRSRKRRTKK